MGGGNALGAAVGGASTSLLIDTISQMNERANKTKEKK